jgi:hypothetical protein
MHHYASGTARLACSMAAGVAKSHMMADSFVNQIAADKLAKAVKAKHYFELKVGKLVTNPRYFVASLVASGADVSRLGELHPSLVDDFQSVWSAVHRYQQEYADCRGWNVTEHWVDTIRDNIVALKWGPNFTRFASEAMNAYCAAVDDIDTRLRLSLAVNQTLIE